MNICQTILPIHPPPFWDERVDTTLCYLYTPHPLWDEHVDSTLYYLYIPPPFGMNVLTPHYTTYTPPSLWDENVDTTLSYYTPPPPLGWTCWHHIVLPIHPNPFGMNVLTSKGIHSTDFIHIHFDFWNAFQTPFKLCIILIDFVPDFPKSKISLLTLFFILHIPEAWMSQLHSNAILNWNL